MKTFQSLRRICRIAAFGIASLAFSPSAPAAVVDTDVIAEGTTMTYRVWLPAGCVVSYAVRGDSDAIDLDLDVVDPDGDIIVADYDPDAIPEVTFRTYQSGYYRIRVQVEDSYRGRDVRYTLHRF